MSASAPPKSDPAGEPGCSREVEAMLASAHADEIADYLTRGRRHEQRADDDLQRDFLAALEEWVPLNNARPQTRPERAALTRLEDFTAEIRLRGREPPYHLSPEMCAQMSRTLRKHGGKSNSGVRAAIREYLDKVDRPN